MPAEDINPWESDTERNLNNSFHSANNKLDNNNIQLSRIFSVWPIILLGAIVGFFVSWTYLRYTVNVYETSMSVVLEGNEEMSPLESIYSTKDPINNQIALIKSTTVSQKVVDSLGLQFHSRLKGKFKDKELFHQFKWRVLSKKSVKTKWVNFEIIPAENGLAWKTGNLTGICHIGKPFFIGETELLIERSNNFNSQDLIICNETDAWAEAESLGDNLRVDPRKESNVAKITLEDIVPERAVAILKLVVPIYNQEARKTKSISLQQGLTFVKDRIVPVKHEIDSIDAIIESKNVQNNADVKTQSAQSYLSQIEDYESKLDDIRLQKARYNDLDQQIRREELITDEILSIASQEPGLQPIISQYEKLQAETERLGRLMTDKNPRLLAIRKSTALAKSRIQLEFKRLRNTLILTESTVQKKLQRARLELNKNPTIDKDLEILLKKREKKLTLLELLQQNEEDISLKLAAVSVKTSLLSPAKLPKEPIRPKRSEIMLAAILAGLILPLAFSTIRELLNNKIISKKQVQQLCSAPVLSEIDFAIKESGPLLMMDNNRSIIGEQFRILRTNLGFYAKKNKPFYVVISSNMSGEGKSFISANLAASFALLGKRVALLEFDLRKPKLRQRFNIPHGKGIVNVLMGEMQPTEIAKPVMEGYVLDLFVSGPIPPNPSELIAMQGMDILKKHLDAQYDVIIVDTPPFGLVTDAQMLDSWADVSLVVVRYMYTLREQVREIEEAKNKRVFKKVALIMNGVKMAGFYGYYNRYGYYGSRRKYYKGYYADKG